MCARLLTGMWGMGTMTGRLTPTPLICSADEVMAAAASLALNWDTGGTIAEPEPSNRNGAELITEAEPGSADWGTTSCRGSICSAAGPCTCRPVSWVEGEGGDSKDDQGYLLIYLLKEG